MAEEQDLRVPHHPSIEHKSINITKNNELRNSPSNPSSPCRVAVDAAESTYIHGIV